MAGLLSAMGTTTTPTETVLRSAWEAAADEAADLLRTWCAASPIWRGDAQAAYRAAADREEAAARAYERLVHDAPPERLLVLATLP